MIIEEIKQIKSTSKDVINFAMLIGGIIALIGLVTLFYRSPAFMYLIPLGLIFMLLGFIAPIIIKPLYFLWMSLAVILGYISTRVILALLYYLIITPIGIIFRLIGKDLLDMKIEKNAETYWIKREIKEYDKKETERQF